MKNIAKHFLLYTSCLYKATAYCLLLFIAMAAKAQRTYSPTADPNDTTRLVIDEKFPYDNRNGWSIGQSEHIRTYLDTQGGYFLLSNTLQNQSFVSLIPKWQHNSESDFVVKVNFSLVKPLIKKPVGGVSGGGFAWGGDAPYRNMQVLYFRYDKPLAEYTVWNEKGEPRLILEKSLPPNNRKDYSIEIRRRGSTLYIYDAAQEDSLQLLFSAPFQPFGGLSNIGFYVSGEMMISSQKLTVREAMTQEELMQAAQQRAEDFRQWNLIADAKEKELQKFADKDKDKLKQKDKDKLYSIGRELVKAYFEMGNIKRLDKDPEATVVFYTMAADLGQQYKVAYYDRLSEFYLGRAFEDKYIKYGMETDKMLAMSHYLNAAKKDRADLGFPGTLKAYYQLKYPFITDFTNYAVVSPYWQHESSAPKTKEEYDRRIALDKENRAKREMIRQQWSLLNRRPKFTARAIVIDNLNPKKSYVASTTATAWLTLVLPGELKMGDFYYHPDKKDFVIAISDGKPYDLKNSLGGVFMNRDYNFDFDYYRDVCKVCHGEGWIKSGGGYSYQVATGRYTETRSSTIVGQTESITRTPVYETHTINTAPTFTKCTACDGTGGPPTRKTMTITIDGQRIN